MKTKIYNIKGEAAGDMDLSDDIFAVKIKPELVHEAFVGLSANQREPWAHTKNRGDVRGGGKKPWAQKGLGRARAGSIRSPIWVGGGVTFGPLNIRNYKNKINKKTRRLALKMCLSDKVKENAFWVVDEFNFTEPKTKVFAQFLSKLPAEQNKFLVLANEDESMVRRMTGNLGNVKTQRAGDVNVMDLVNAQAVIVSKAGIEKIEEILK